MQSLKSMQPIVQICTWSNGFNLNYICIRCLALSDVCYTMLLVGYLLSALYISPLVSRAENLFSLSFRRQQFGTQVVKTTSCVQWGKTVSVKYITIFVQLSDHNLQRCESWSDIWISQEVLCCRHLNNFSHHRKIARKKNSPFYNILLQNT